MYFKLWVMIYYWILKLVWWIKIRIILKMEKNKNRIEIECII